MPQNLSCIHTGSMCVQRNTISVDNSGKNTETFSSMLLKHLFVKR